MTAPCDGNGATAPFDNAIPRAGPHDVVTSPSAHLTNCYPVTIDLISQDYVVRTRQANICQIATDIFMPLHNQSSIPTNPIARLSRAEAPPNQRPIPHSFAQLATEKTSHRFTALTQSSHPSHLSKEEPWHNQPRTHTPDMKPEQLVQARNTWQMASWRIRETLCVPLGLRSASIAVGAEGQSPG